MASRLSATPHPVLASLAIPPSPRRGKERQQCPTHLSTTPSARPRGRGKADGSLHEVTALNLAAQTLAAVKDRNKLDPKLVDDVVLGCVDPVGEAGGDIARAAALVAGLRR